MTVSKPHIVLISSAPVPVDPVWSRAHVYLCKAGSYTLDETIMVVLSVDGLFHAAIRIQLQEQSVSVTFTRKAITIKFPTTRRLAEFLQVPHYYILPYFAMMEQEELVTRAERVGILTTAGGSRKMIALMEEKYPREIEEIIGPTIFSEMVKRSR